MRKGIILLLLGFVVCICARWIPQYNATFEGEDVPLFSGGFERPRPCVIDLDGDGDLDIVWSHHVKRLILWENTGTASDLHFEITDELWGGFEPTDNQVVPALGDLDGDGDFDLITGGSMGLLYRYENTGGTALHPEMTLIESDYLEIDVGWNSYPVLVDIDSDGDLDLFVTGNDGFLLSYENVGDATTPDFVFADTVLNHGSAKIGLAMHDVNLDGLIDIAFIKNSSLYLVPNEGTSTDPEFSAIDSSYFTNASFPAVGLGLGDLDGDDLPEVIIGGQHYGLQLHKNTGTAADPTWDRISHWQMIDATYTVIARMVDINGDGLKDIYLSGYNEIYALENVGTVGDPAWVINYDFTDSIPYNSAWRPDFVDLDSDGDYDMVCGSWDSQLHYFENIGSATEPLWATVVDGWMGIDHEVEYLSPNFVDIDDDGDLDLFVGDESKQMYYYENIGSATSPDFADSVGLGDFPGAGTSMNLYRPGMTFIDYDEDGDYDIIGGADYSDSKLAYWENTGTASSPEWLTMVEDIIDTSYGNLTSASPIDYNADGVLDMLCGSDFGGMFLYLAEAVPGVEEADTRPNYLTINAYPNPFNSAVRITIDGVGAIHELPLRVEIYDVAGRKTAQLPVGEHLRVLPNGDGTENGRAHRSSPTQNVVFWQPADNIGSGVYLVRATAGDKSVTKRVVYLK